MGDCVSALETMRGVLKCAAHAIDEDPGDKLAQAHFRALVARHIVHGGAITILERAASAGGARPLCLDEASRDASRTCSSISRSITGAPTPRSWVAL